MNSGTESGKWEIDGSKIVLRRDAPEPLYLQLATELKKQIAARPPGEGGKMLSMLQLSRRLKTDRTTVQKSYGLLCAENVIASVSPRKFAICSRAKCCRTSPFPNIGIILPYSFTQLIESNYGMPLEYIKGITDALVNQNISMTFLELPKRNAPADEIEHFNNELPRKLTGVIHIGGRSRRIDIPDPPLEALMKDERIPQVMISMYSHLPNIGSVVSDSAPPAYALAEQFRNLHHRRIGFGLLSPLKEESSGDSAFSYEVSFRASIIRKVFLEYGFDCRDEYHCFSCVSGDAVYRQLLRKKRDGCLPTVYWCLNDQMALYFLEAFEKLGYGVPEDISLVGYDGIYSCAEKAGITTMSLPFYRIGYQAVKLLREYATDGISDRNRLLKIPAALVIRKTLAKSRETLDPACHATSNVLTERRKQ